MSTTLLKRSNQLSKSRAFRSMYGDNRPIKAVTVLEQDLSQENVDLAPQALRAGDTGDSKERLRRSNAPELSRGVG